jgi:AraC-like DNA-binding protein
MKKTIVIKPKSPLLSKWVDFFLFIQSENITECSYVTYANSNYCIAIYKSNEVLHNPITNVNQLVDSSKSFSSYLLGNYTSPNHVTISSNIDAICINFNYSALINLTNIPVNELLNQNGAFERIFGYEAYCKLELVFSQNSLNSRLHILESILYEALLSRESETNFINYAINQIQLNKGQVKIKDLLYDIGSSRTKFYSTFKKRTGQTAKEFIDTVKFRTALSALESQNRKLSLTTLSYILGYTDQSHFIKAFKKRSGVSPLQFKKSSKNENGFTWTE